MTSTGSYRRRRPPRRPGAAARRFAALWHLAWAGVVAAAGAGLSLQGLIEPGPEIAALGAGVAAALCGALLAAIGGEAAGAAAVLLFGLAGTAACLLTGAAGGPLAAWCLAPLAAASAFGRARLLSLGASATVAAAGVVTLGSLLLDPPQAAPAAAGYLSALALLTVAVGAGAGLAVAQGRGRAERSAWRELEVEMRELLSRQPQMLISLYLDGRILEAYGVAPPGLEGLDLRQASLAELAGPEARAELEAALRQAAERGAAQVAFAPAGHPQGWCVLTLRRLTPLRLIAALRDAGAERAQMVELQQALAAAEQQSTGKSRFLANMSHELRTPLNAIMGFSDIMRQRLFGPMSDRYAEYAELIHESGAHLLELINDVLDISKIEADRFDLASEVFDARETVEAVLRLMRGQAERAKVELRGLTPAAPLEAEADRRALKQIAINLVSNALKFTPAGGAVTLTLRASGEVLELIVEDTGVGIAPGDLERLGRPFEQAGDAQKKAAGAGLGLSLVRAFAKLHGGDMQMESALGQGTKVTVRLPVLASPRAALAAKG